MVAFLSKKWCDNILDRHIGRVALDLRPIVCDSYSSILNTLYELPDRSHTNPPNVRGS